MSAADAVALARALATAPVAVAIALDLPMVAFAIFVAAAASDAVDGWLARRSGSLAARGAFVDPLADKILVLGTLFALAFSGAGWPVTVVAVLVGLREGIVLVARMRAYARGIALPADRVAKAKTALEMVGVALILLAMRPWAVIGTALVGIAWLVSLVTLPEYLGTRD